jgi:hypothetical protein
VQRDYSVASPLPLPDEDDRRFRVLDDVVRVQRCDLSTTHSGVRRESQPRRDYWRRLLQCIGQIFVSDRSRQKPWQLWALDVQGRIGQSVPSFGCPAVERVKVREAVVPGLRSELSPVEERLDVCRRSRDNGTWG